MDIVEINIIETVEAVSILVDDTKMGLQGPPGPAGVIPELIDGGLIF